MNHTCAPALYQNVCRKNVLWDQTLLYWPSSFWLMLPAWCRDNTHTHTHTVYLSGHASEWAYLCTFKEFDSGFTSLSIYSLRNRHTAICCGRRGGVAFKTFPLLTWVKLGQWLQPFTPAWDTYVFLVYVRAYKSVTDTRVQTTKNRT